MTGAEELSFNQIRNWVSAESEKGRPMKEIVAELATHEGVNVLSVQVTLLSKSPVQTACSLRLAAEPFIEHSRAF